MIKEESAPLHEEVPTFDFFPNNIQSDKIYDTVAARFRAKTQA